MLGLYTGLPAYSIQFVVEPLVGKYHPLVYGTLVVLVILFLPKGLISLWDRALTAFRARANGGLARKEGA